MKPTDKFKETVEIRGVFRGEEDEKHHVEKGKLKTRSGATVKYIERKLIDKGVQRQERHPVDGLPLKHHPKKGHGGKYTWEGPGEELESELDPVPPAIDEKDPNYVEEETAEGEDEVVVGEVEVAKTAETGVARIDVDDHYLKTN